MTAITPVVLVGGAGTRLWPLSRRAKPKQFHALLGAETLLQATAARVSGSEGEVRFALPIVVSGEAHAVTVREQLGPDAVGRLVLEPVGRSTAPCAVVAAEMAGGVQGSDLILLLPSDHFVADGPGFRRAVAQAAPAAAAGRLVTFGIPPTRPETGFGYILADGDGPLRPVRRFVEKPDAPTAAQYVADGRYFWNAGIFLMRADRLLEEMERFRPDILTAARAALRGATEIDGALRLDADAFAACPSESLDYAVMEQTTDAVVAPIDIGWSDIGGFDALWEAADKDSGGNAAHGDTVLIDVADSFVQTDGPVVAVIGVSDLVVVVQDGAVLIAPRNRAQDVKAVVDRLRAEGRDDRL
jgi:mannose-1-phosphate guanylyltransferase/mannose-6-phosphate isomerase